MEREFHHLDKISFEDYQKNKSEVDPLMIALGLIFNDLQSSYSLFIVYQEKFSDKEVKPYTPIFGQKNGVQLFIERSMSAIIKEFFVVILNNQKIIEGDAFQKLLSKCHPNKKESKRIQSRWNELLKMVNQKQNKMSGAYKYIFEIRHKVTSHYDAKYLYKYGLPTTESPIELSDVYWSEGEHIVNTRFYFSDRVAQNCMVRAHDKYSENKHDNANFTHELLKESEYLLFYLLVKYYNTKRSSGFTS